MIPKLPRLSDYGVSPVFGFLPSELPLEILPDLYYSPWEAVIRNLQPLILSKRLRGVVDKLPILSTDLLQTESEWRRAYQILAFISHAYIWGGNIPADVLPPSISVPFIETAQHFELPTVATYAAVALWNWKPVFPDEPIDDLENLATLSTFTGSLDESWFYVVSVAIEARAAPSITLMLAAIEAARCNDSFTVTECLRSFAELLDDLGALLMRMYESCDPHVFYHRIRPFLAGSKNMADAGLPNGVIFDNGSGQDQTPVHFSGGSNAQSSIIQFFDLVLGVEHRPTGDGPPHVTDDSKATGPPAPSHSFMKEMRKYMPGPHRRFLEHVASVANIRPYVNARRSDRALCTSYDACLAMLRALRDKHIQLVSRYIVVKSRESRPHSRSLSPRQAQPNLIPQPMNIANASSDEANSRKLRGTGGTALIPFLKQARDETGEPAIDAWARRLLGNGPADAAGKGARMTKVGELASGEVEIVGLAGTWSLDDSEGGICHW
ncbi:indoleamine 2,3-dioxygenase subfamily [Patellaria atrata CBS 101060]|uniref:Indoleamine 2,3-dioxygenase n=1 Tax=Patellaria atrata CBS 101060 TaxID=1346257 RepID=A0A9P4SB65_9PEZI|nr:indoleamine 2,3-dioxygenase subfamily [Patellaria atrata CBS 101060]